MKKKFQAFLEKKGVTPEQFKELSAGEMAGHYNEFNGEQAEELKTAMESKLDDKLDVEALEAFKTEFQEFREKEVKVILDAIKLQGAAISAMKETPKGTDGPITLTKELTDNGELLKGIAKRSGEKSEIELKALTTRASVTNNEQAFDLADIGQLATAKLTMMDLFPKITITSSNHNGTIRYYDWDPATTVRAAAMVAEGAVFPESTAKWVKKTIDLQKVGDTLPVTEEFFEDEAMFAAELEMFLRINVAIEVNDQLVNGSGAGNNLKGVVITAPAFVPVASGIVDASIYDLIVKVSEDITTTGGNKYSPNFALMNIADINLMRLKKDANNNYIMPPFVDRNGNKVGEIVVIEENDIVANTMVIGDSRYGRIYEKEGVTISRGVVNAQFTEDEMTLKVRQRLALLIRDVDATGFSKVTSISAALVTLAL